MLFIAAIAATAGLVWAAIYSLRGSLLLGCTALLVVGYCFGHQAVNFSLGPFPLTIDRLVVAALLAIYAAQRYLGLADPKRLTWTDVGLLAFCAVLVVSTLAHDWRPDDPDKVSPLWLLVAGYLIPVVVYFLARNARLSQRAVTAAYGLLAVFGVYLVVTALAEATQQWWLVFPKYIADPNVGIHFGRARGPLLQAHSLGLYLAMCLLAIWAWQHRLPLAARYGALLFLPVGAAAIYFTYTRCAWLGAGLGALAVLVLSVRPYLRPYLLAGLLLTGGTAALLGWDRMSGIEREAGAAAARESVSQRASFSYVSWKMFADRPLWGFGFGQFTDAKLPYLSDRSAPLHLDAIRLQPHHNTFLSLLTETGLVGLGLYLAVLIGWARHAWQMCRDGQAPPHVRTQGTVMLAALGIYLGPALFFDLAYSPPDQLILFLLAGLTMGLRLSSQREVSHDEEAAHGWLAPSLAVHSGGGTA